MNNEGQIGQHKKKEKDNQLKKNTFSFTPSPGGKKPFINKFPLEDVDEFDNIVSKQNFTKLDLTYKFNSLKPSRDNESLLNKMPNFLKNYDDLIDLIKIDSREKLDKPQQKTIEEFIYNKEKKIIDHLSVEEEKIVQNLTNSEEIKDFYEYTEECLKRIATMKVPDIETIEHLRLDLPFVEELKTKKLAIFDLDETLVHCEIKKPQKGEVQINVKLPNGELAKIGLNIRPAWKECLERIKSEYVIIIYTASHKSYADSVLDYLDPNGEYIQYRLYRHNCVEVYVEGEKMYVKDLRIFKNVKMEDMIIIDNSVLSFSFQLENGIPILPFYDNYDDNELLFLRNYLCDISKVKDLREENKIRIKMDYFLHTAKGDIDIDNEYKSNRSEENKSNLIELNVMNYSSIESESELNNSELDSSRIRKKPHSLFQEQFINTLDDLKKTFEKNKYNK